jgi:hypothetical protein
LPRYNPENPPPSTIFQPRARGFFLDHASTASKINIHNLVYFAESEPFAGKFAYIPKSTLEVAILPKYYCLSYCHGSITADRFAPSTAGAHMAILPDRPLMIPVLYE